MEFIVNSTCSYESREAAENKVNVELILFSEAKRRMLAVLLRERQAPRHIMLFVAVAVSLQERTTKGYLFRPGIADKQRPSSGEGRGQDNGVGKRGTEE